MKAIKLLPSRPKCRDCDLYKSAQNPGIPSRPLEVTGKNKALLVVGEAPGFNEDKQGKSWVGRSGNLLQKFISTIKFSDEADIYLSNSCRCAPPQGDKPSKKQRTTCAAHLIQDISTLSYDYEEVIILCCGASATASMTNSKHTIKTAIRHQGAKLSAFYPASRPNITLFFTYHPAILMPGRKPALVGAVESHFTLVKKYLTGEVSPNKLPFHHKVSSRVPVDRIKKSTVISVDIETYGILKGQDQTVFHPQKSKYVDGVDFDNQIVSVAFALKIGQEYYAYSYVWSNEHDRRHIINWFVKIKEMKKVLLGQNIPFDISYLKQCSTVLDYIIKPSKEIVLDDTLVLSFLLYDQRPEKGLKELSKLLGIFNYDSLTLTARNGKAKDEHDKHLHRYNAIDAVATLMLRERLRSYIRSKYKNNSAKLTPICTEMRNESLWNIITMQKGGVTLDYKELKSYHLKLCDRINNIVAELDNNGIIAKGKGSTKSKRSFLMNLIFQYNLENDTRILYTEKQQDLSISLNNYEVIKSVCPQDDKSIHLLDLLIEYEHLSKMVGSYTRKLLEDKKRGVVKRQTGKALCFPTWFVTPRVYGKDSTGSEGGTIQARYSAKDPAVQTFPAPIKKMFTSKFRGGSIDFWDYSQMELRIVALLSGDPSLIETYKKGEDLHDRTTLEAIPGASKDSPDWKIQRHLGKTVNFLIVYLGGPSALQKTAYSQCGVALSMEQCKQIIGNFDKAHPVLRNWQNTLIDKAKKQGYIELITGWSRTYSLGQGAIDTYRNEICNHPVQTLAAQVCQSAQYDVVVELVKRKMKSYPFIQIHDSIGFDVYPGEFELLQKVIDKCLPAPTIYGKITRELGRYVPLEIDYEG